MHHIFFCERRKEDIKVKNATQIKHTAKYTHTHTHTQTHTHKETYTVIQYIISHAYYIFSSTVANELLTALFVDSIEWVAEHSVGASCASNNRLLFILVLLSV